jgi:hypothetical protein
VERVKDAEVRAAVNEEARKAAEERVEHIKREATKDMEIMRLQMQLAQFQEGVKSPAGVPREGEGVKSSAGVLREGEGVKSPAGAPKEGAESKKRGYDDVLSDSAPSTSTLARSSAKFNWIIAYEADEALSVEVARRTVGDLVSCCSERVGDRWISMLKFQKRIRLSPASKLALKMGLGGALWIEAVDERDEWEGFDVEAVTVPKLKAHMSTRLWSHGEGEPAKFPMVRLVE